MSLFKLQWQSLVVLVRLARFLRMPVPPVPGVSAIIVRRDKILVNNLTYKDGFSLPGGIMKTGEDCQQAIVREVREETGLRITKLRFFGTYTFSWDYPGFSVVFLAEVRPGRLRRSKEGTPLWADLNSALTTLVHEDNIKALTDYLKKKE